MKKILSIILSITMLLSMGTVAFADGVDGPMQKAKLTVGINAEFPPFEYYEGEELKGFDIDLMNYIGERIGFDIDFVNMSFDKLIPAVVSGEVDCAISAISITEERKSVIDYSIPYLTAIVSFKEGEEWLKDKEKYAIIFPKTDRISKSSITPEEYIYSQVNIAIEELRDDHTIEKLIEKYDLKKPFDEEADINYKYEIPETVVTDAVDTVDWSEATSSPIPSEWAEKEIDIARAVGITDENKDYLYKENITREEFCELIYSYIVNVAKAGIPKYDTMTFTDTDNEKIAVLCTMDIIKGKTTEIFAPNDLLTREEAATIIFRLIDAVHPDWFAHELFYEFADSIEISDWAMDSIQRLCNMGIMKGVENNNFAPKGNYTTEQAIATLVRVRNNFALETTDKIIGGADGPTAIYLSNSIDMNKLKKLYPEFFETEGTPFKGVEVYVWQMAENSYMCGLMFGTNRNKTDDEILSLQEKALTVDEAKAILNVRGIAQEDVFVIPVKQPYSSYYYEIDDEYKERVIKLFNDSNMYSQNEIDDAIKVIVDEFQGWKGCTLTSIYYGGDELSKAHQEWADRNDADEVIVLLSSFDVDESGGDGSLNPNSTYDDWMWILVRKNGGQWMHVDHGY